MKLFAFFTLAVSGKNLKFLNWKYSKFQLNTAKVASSLGNSRINNLSSPIR